MNAPAPQNSDLGITLAKIGSWLQLGPLAGLLGTIYGISRAFVVLEQQTTGMSDPTRLSGAVGEVLVFSFIGVGFAALGLVILIVALTKYRVRRWWAKAALAWALLSVFGFAVAGLFVMMNP